MKRYFISLGLLFVLLFDMSFSIRQVDVAQAGSAASSSTGFAAAPVTTHPRLWLTTTDLPRLRSWAVDSNPMYLNGLKVALDSAVTHANQHWSWSFNGGTGKPDSGWQDDGGINWAGDATEGYAEFFAFNSLVDTDPAKRDLYGRMSRDMLMYVMNQAVLGHANAPFRHSVFATNNRSNAWGEAFGLTVDWIYPYLTSQDKVTIRSVFLMWANDLINASTTASEHPQPIGVMNDPQLLSDKKQLRWAANNYYTGHMRMLTMLSLCMDAADDPPLDPSKPVTQLGNTLRSYIPNVTGAWLYQQYAMYEDPTVVAAEYGVSADGLGLSRGGLSAEGFLYGTSLGNLHHALLALYTAGYSDQVVSGPQIKLIGSSFWEQNLDSMLHSITPTSKVYGNGHEYLGPLYQMMSYGDLQRFWIMSSDIVLFGSVGIYAEKTGDTINLQKARWMAANVLEGGEDKLYERAGNIWGNTYATHAIMYFMLFDPAAATPTDPRPDLPTTFSSPGINRVISRTDWTVNGSWFGYMCGWATINHQYGNCNQFDFYRKGEWLTRERSGYMDDGISLTPDYHNILSIKNSVSSGSGQPPTNLSWFEPPSWERGAQWSNGYAAGDPSALISWGDAYVYGYGDATNLYNRPNKWNTYDDATDVLHASRSILWLKPDHIVIYDRATTKTSNFKRFNLTLLASPVISGNTATITTAGGQKLYIQSLLPANATITSSSVENFQSVADLEPTTHRLAISAPGNPTDARFLTVLQGADAGTAMDTGTIVQSSGGSAYTGVTVGGVVIMFAVDSTMPAANVTYVVPDSIAGHLITGLTPNENYSVTLTPGTGTVQVDVMPGSGYTSDNAGVITVGQLGSLFADVPLSHWAYTWIERLFNAGITGGCGTNPLIYCPDAPVTRAQMAIFILRGIHGSSYVPPAATGTKFGDVPADAFAADWIEQLAAEGITAGCGNNNYCPDAGITRAQMAIFLLRGKYGSSFTPPAATGTAFGDVPADAFAADWIEQLATEGITGGCGGGNYCPDANVTRAEMAVFLVRAFNLP